MNISDLVPWRDRSSTLRRRNGGQSLQPLRREMDRLFDEFFRGWESGFGSDEGTTFNPALNLVESDDAIEATMELPGLSEDDIEITLGRDGLTVTGEKRGEEEERGKNYYRRERRYGYFRRTIPLPPEAVDAENVEAKFDKGVLTITMPKYETARTEARRIEVKSS